MEQAVKDKVHRSVSKTLLQIISPDLVERLELYQIVGEPVGLDDELWEYSE
jgi:hypothetical protein